MDSAPLFHRPVNILPTRPRYLGLCFLGALLCWSASHAVEACAASARDNVDRGSSTVTTDSQSIFIGKDPDTGDDVIRVTPRRQPEQQQPQMPYIVPEVTVPWTPYDQQHNTYPPHGGSGNGGGMYPPYPPSPDRPIPPDRPDYPNPPDRPDHPNRPDHPWQPSHGGLQPRPPDRPDGPPHDTPYPPPDRPDYPGRPGHGDGGWNPGGWNGRSGWRPPAWRPGQNRPDRPAGGGVFVYQPGREFPRFPRGNSPYAPLGPSGPIILPPSGR